MAPLVSDLDDSVLKYLEHQPLKSNGVLLFETAMSLVGDGTDKAGDDWVASPVFLLPRI